ncbi:rod-determining factor RdfA [Haloarcula marismortui]|uniref:rod-determining factor RdfA n=1 Tax=Haloarcula marismortui TaxID=2238 RepID=UPI003C7553CC
MGSAQSKVGRLIETYGLESMGSELERAWLGDGQERQSLRDLADRFNRALLVAAIRDAGMDVVDGEPANFYRLLTADDVSAGKRVEARNRLERAGIDVERLVEEFVTYQAIRYYLTEVRGASYDPDRETEQVERERDTIDRLRSRVETIVRDTVDRLQTADRLTVGEYRVFVSIDIRCQDCGTRHSISDLLDRGGCNCR